VRVSDYFVMRDATMKRRDLHVSILHSGMAPLCLRSGASPLYLRSDASPFFIQARHLFTIVLCVGTVEYKIDKTRKLTNMVTPNYPIS
jgi:hypothetical protein